jgi:hypothetical protein
MNENALTAPIVSSFLVSSKPYDHKPVPVTRATLLIRASYEWGSIAAHKPACRASLRIWGAQSCNPILDEESAANNRPIRQASISPYISNLITFYPRTGSEIVDKNTLAWISWLENFYFPKKLVDLLSPKVECSELVIFFDAP